MDRRLSQLTLHTTLVSLADLVMPRVCIVCGTGLMPSEKHLCCNCSNDLPLTRFENMERNPMADRYNERIEENRTTSEPYQRACALFYYDTESGYGNITQALKYHRNISTGKYFSSQLGRILATSPLFKDADLVIPVPLHWTRRLSRGYNQAEIIAAQIAKEFQKAGGHAIVEKRLLFRPRKTGTQTKLKGEEKAGNVRGAFLVDKNKAANLTGLRHIMVVDDVFTSGNTLNECHKTLRSVFGPEVRISAISLGFTGD